MTNRHVFIVDDNPIDRMLLRKALIRGGAEVEFHEFQNGREALSHFIARKPDLMLLDVRMPGMDGFRVLTEIRKLPGGQGYPVVMVSSSDERDDLTRAHGTGATAYFPKPGSVTGYTDLAARICSKWLPPSTVAVAS